jgi:hypothetical protein
MTGCPSQPLGWNFSILASLISRRGWRRALLCGAFLLCAGTIQAQSVDPSFDPGTDGDVLALVTYPVSKTRQILVAGQFRTIAGVRQAYLARINDDGSPDVGFAPVIDAPVKCALVDPTNGKIVIGGQFTSVNGIRRQRIARLNSDGSLDRDFDVGSGADSDVMCLAFHGESQRILLGGSFGSVGQQPRRGVARLNRDGSIDLSFENPKIAGQITSGIPAGVHCLLARPSGDIMIGGNFASLGGQTRYGFALLAGNGSPRAELADPPQGILRTIIDWRGNPLIGGSLFHNDSFGNFVGLRENSSDYLFTPIVTGQVTSIAPQPDGSIVLGGTFTRIYPFGRQSLSFEVRGLARVWLDAPGVDGRFRFDLTPSVPASAATIVLARDDGSTIVGGTFSAIGGVRRANLARVLAPVPSRITNLSVRSHVSSDSDLTLGFSVDAPKQVLLRAIGPSLERFGVPDFLATPQLEFLRAADVSGLRNSGWNDDPALTAAFGATGAFPLNGGTRDAALLALAPRGTATARITGAGRSGVVLAEVYDREAPNSKSETRNLSALATVTADSPVVAGFTVAGDTVKVVVIRAVGPTLAAFGVTDAIPDPQLSLIAHSSYALMPQGGLKVANDNWDASVRNAFSAVGAFQLPLNSKDAVVWTWVDTGTYSVVVSGVNGATGRVLLEIYVQD